MSEPDFLICMECESPVYVFEWKEGRLVEALCTVCGNDDIVAFATEEELEALALEHSDEGDGK
jgi:hypothetical protein